MTFPGQDTPVTAGIYCRMSLVAMGDTTKVDDQERISRDLAGRLRWPVAGVYCDNSRSAWQRNRKRPAWDQMLADVDSGKLGGIIVYHGDRLVRQPFDLETLINLSYGKGIRLASPTGMRDLGNPDDLYILRIETASACRESDRTSQRRKAQYERWRLEGRTRPGGRGGRAFGFESDGLTHRAPDRCIIATRQPESEVDVCREAARRLLDGESRGSVVRDLAARGWETPAGAPMTGQTLKKILMRPRTAGLMPDGESKGAWEPVLDRDTWERLRLVLAAKAEEFGYASNARRWLLSGIAVCGECGSPLQVNPSKGRGRKEYASGYACRAPGCGKVYRSAPHLDEYVAERVRQRLANPLNPEGRALPVDHAAEWAALEREQAETSALLADYKASAGRTRPLMTRLDAIDARMAELRELAAGDGRSRLLERYAGMSREDWEDDEKTPLDVKRALVAACFRVTVLPASGRGPGFRVQDVDVVPLP